MQGRSYNSLNLNLHRFDFCIVANHPCQKLVPHLLWWFAVYLKPNWHGLPHDKEKRRWKSSGVMFQSNEINTSKEYYPGKRPQTVRS